MCSCTKANLSSRLNVCAAVLGFAATEAPADIAAQACGLERLLADADEALAVNIVEASRAMPVPGHSPELTGASDHFMPYGLCTLDGMIVSKEDNIF